MTAVPFTKASACGNDFLIIDGMHAPPDLAAFSRAICGRHNGVGADGVEWLFPAQDADIRARLLNADGGEAEISGNGTRCVAAYLCADDPREKVTVRTGAGVKTCTLISHTDMSFEFETAMGEPQVGDEFSIKVAFGEVRGIPVSMGNPHFSVFVDEFPIGWQGEGAEIGKHHDFQHGINVEFVKVNRPDDITMRVWERGSGETLACGTGASAVCVAGVLSGRTERAVTVHLLGGDLQLLWSEKDNHIYMTGPAVEVFSGDWTD